MCGVAWSERQRNGFSPPRQSPWGTTMLHALCKGDCCCKQGRIFWDIDYSRRSKICHYNQAWVIILDFLAWWIGRCLCRYANQKICNAQVAEGVIGSICPAAIPNTHIYTPKRDIEQESPREHLDPTICNGGDWLCSVKGQDYIVRFDSGPLFCWGEGILTWARFS